MQNLVIHKKHFLKHKKCPRLVWFIASPHLNRAGTDIYIQVLKIDDNGLFL